MNTLHNKKKLIKAIKNSYSGLLRLMKEIDYNISHFSFLLACSGNVSAISAKTTTLPTTDSALPIPNIYSSQSWCQINANDFIRFDFNQNVTLTGLMVQGGQKKLAPPFKVKCGNTVIKTAGGMKVSLFALQGLNTVIQRLYSNMSVYFKINVNRLTPHEFLMFVRLL